MVHQQSPSFFVHGPSPFARLVVFASLSLMLIASDARFNYLNQLRVTAVSFLAPLQWIANRPAVFYHNITEHFTTQHQLRSQIKRLDTQALVNLAALQELKSLQIENAHLRSLFETSQASTRPTKMAEIVHLGFDPFSHKVIVNIGLDKEIKAGQAAIGADGVLGQVTRVYEHTSEVTLLTDQDLSIPVQIERNGLRAIAFGSGKDHSIHLPYLPANVDIKVGDRLVTSGIDGVYSAGLGVATVKHVHVSDGSPFASIVATPIAAVQSFRQLLLLDLDPATAVNEEVSKVLEQEKIAKSTKNKKSDRRKK
jgi:rod shape-determining protein MreC